jgi:CHAT domain-containing protein
MHYPGLNIRWLMENSDRTVAAKMPLSSVDFASILDRHESQASRVLRGLASLKRDQVDRFIERTELVMQIPEIDAAWFDLEPNKFAERMRLQRYGRWAQAASTSGWIDTLRSLANGRFLPEQELRRNIRPSAYRSDFGVAPDPADVVDATVQIGSRYGIAIESPHQAILPALEARAARVVLLHRAISDVAFAIVEVDQQSAIHLVAPFEADADGSSQSAAMDKERTLILAKIEKGMATTRYGFEVGGLPGRRELAVFVLGTPEDLAKTWRATPISRVVAPDELSQLREAVATGTDRGDILCGPAHLRCAAMTLQDAFDAHAEAEAALSRGDTSGLNKAIATILAATSGAREEPATSLRASGFEFAAILALVKGDADGAEIQTDSAENLVPAIHTPEIRQHLKHIIARLRSDIARLRGDRGQTDISAANALFEILGLRADRDTSQQELRPALVRRAASDPGKLDPNTRFKAADLIVFSLAQDAFMAGKSGEAIAWLDIADRFLPDLPSEGAIPIIITWASMYRAEAVRRSSKDDLERSTERAIELFQQLDCPPEVISNLVSMTLDFAKLDLACMRGEPSEAIAVAAQRILASPALASSRTDLKVRLEALAKGTSRKDFLEMPVRRDHPAYNMRRLALAMNHIASDDIEAGLAALLELLIDEHRPHDHDLGFGVPLIIGRFLLSLYNKGENAPAGVAAAAVLKMAIRDYEALRLDTAANARDRLSMLGDTMVREAYALLRELLISQGRIGQAIRINALLDQEDRRVPRTAAGAMAEVAAKRVPLSAEEEALWPMILSTARLVQTGQTRVTPKQWLVGLGSLIKDSVDTGKKSGFADNDDWIDQTGVALLGYLLHEDKLLVRSRFGQRVVVRTVRIGSPNLLGAAIYDLERALRAPGSQYRDVCHRVYDLLIAPVADTLVDSSIHTVVIEARGLIARVPFAALYDGKDHLVRRFSIVAHGTQRPRSEWKGTSAVAVSLSMSRTPGMDALPQASVDAAILKSAAEQNGLSVFARSDGEVTAAVLEEALRLDPSIFHISGHFESDPADMGRSAFILGDGSRAALTDFARHDLSRLDLMLLMGCETLSRTDGRDSRAGTGLDDALLRLGVRTVVGALWPIDDEVAAFVLTGFLQAYLGMGRGKAEALRLAQLAVLDNDEDRLRHPHFWAPYVVSGEWS